MTDEGVVYSGGTFGDNVPSAGTGKDDVSSAGLLGLMFLLL